MTHNEQMSKLPCVPNFVSYVSAKYYLNWFIVGKVIAKLKRVNFFRDTVYVVIILEQINMIMTMMMIKL